MSVITPSLRTTRRSVLLGSAAAGLAAVCYGFSQFLARRLVTELAPPLMVATYALLVGLLILATVSHRSLVHDRYAPRRAFLLMTLAGVSATAGATFNLFALSLAPVVIVSPVSAVNPLISLGLAHLFLQRLERITFRIWIGAAMAVTGVIIITFNSA